MIIFTPQSPDGVCLSDRDGAYLKIEQDVAQIIVLGPMLGTPLDYERALCEHAGRSWIIGEAEFLQHSNTAMSRIALRRGFVSLLFREVTSADEVFYIVSETVEQVKARMI